MNQPRVPAGSPEGGQFASKEYHAYVEHANINSRNMVEKSGGELIKEGPHGKTFRVRVK